MVDQFHWAGAAHMLLDAAEALGVPKERVLRMAGMAWEDLPASPGRIPWSQLEPLTQVALELTGEPAFGLLAGFQINIKYVGVVGTYYMHMSPVRASQELAYREVWPRLTNMLRCWHEERGDLAFNCVEILPPLQPLIEPHLHMFLAMHVGVLRHLFGDACPIDHIALRSSSLGDADRMSALMGCPVLLGQPRDWLAVPRATLERPMPLTDPWLCEQLRPQFEAFLRMLDQRLLTTIAVSTDLDSALGSAAATDLEAVAARMQLKPRTLQARLAAEGTSFTSTLDTVRKEFSLRQLSFPGVKIAALASQVGFSDPAAFTRAFRRWTGATPKEWQERQNAKVAAPEQVAPRRLG